jgi:hypothetical protein
MNNIISTLCGDVSFTLTSGDHVYITEVKGSSLFPHKGSGKYIPHHVSLHLYLKDNQWTKETESCAYITRQDKIGEYATPACRKIIIKALTEAWIEYISNHPQLLIIAEVAHIKENVDRLNNKIQEKELEINTLLQERESLSLRLAKIEDKNECMYCGGNCPNEPENSPNLCDGFAGDIDDIYEQQRRDEKHGLYSQHLDESN